MLKIKQVFIFIAIDCGYKEFIMKQFRLLFSIIAMFVMIGCGGGGGGIAVGVNDTSTQNNTSTEVNKRLVSVYMVGSDLEGSGNLASRDLAEMLLGYAKLINESKEDNIKLLVAFGGSKKTNWTGVKYADMQCLTQDVMDGVFGNDTCYLYEDSTKNMGSGNTLKNFIDYVKGSLQKDEKSFMIFWNHGGAYDGLCYDTNNGADQITLEELHNALSDSDVLFDTIGMDACLMANLEVAKSIKGYAKYFIASEELEPGHGWDYEDIIYLAATESNSVTLGKKIVDSYIDSSRHSATQDKTLSLIELSKIDDVVSKLDGLSLLLDATADFVPIGLSAYESQRFSQSNTFLDGMTLDLKDFAQLIIENKTNTKTDAEKLVKSIEEFVLYSRHQSTKYGSNGISIYQPLNNKGWNTYKNLNYTASTNWYNLLSEFTVKKGNDVQAPTISSETSCTKNSLEGHCLNISDDIAIKSVESFGLVPFGDNYLLLFSQILSAEAGEYFMPKLGSKWFYLNDSDDSNNYIFPSAMEIKTNSIEYRLYFTQGQYNNEDVLFFFKIDNSNNLIAWATPMTSEDYATKLQYEIKKGDKVRFDFYIYSESSDSFIYMEGNEITLKGNPVWSYENFNADVDYFAVADDFNNNTESSQMYKSSAK
jgi:hypothetical protein